MKEPTKPPTLTRTPVEWVANPFELFLGIKTDMGTRRMDGTRVTVPDPSAADPARLDIFVKTGNWIFSTITGEDPCPVCNYPAELPPHHTMTCNHRHK